MSRALSLPVSRQGKGRDKEVCVMEDLAGSVRNNYFTFYSWSVRDGEPGKRRTLSGRLLSNYATFTQWGK